MPLTPHRTLDEEGFAAKVETRRLAGMNRARLRSRPQRTDHGPREVARTDGAYYFVNLQLAGRCITTVEGRTTVVRRGEIVVVDTAEPYFFHLDRPWQMLSFRVPHAALDAALRGRRPELGRPVTATGAGAAVRALMPALWSLDAADTRRRRARRLLRHRRRRRHEHDEHEHPHRRHPRRGPRPRRAPPRRPRPHRHGRLPPLRDLPADAAQPVRRRGHVVRRDGAEPPPRAGRGGAGGPGHRGRPCSRSPLRTASTTRRRSAARSAAASGSRRGRHAPESSCTNGTAPLHGRPRRRRPREPRLETPHPRSPHGRVVPAEPRARAAQGRGARLRRGAPARPRRRRARRAGPADPGDAGPPGDREGGRAGLPQGPGPGTVRRLGVQRRRRGDLHRGVGGAQPRPHDLPGRPAHRARARVRGRDAGADPAVRRAVPRRLRRAAGGDGLQRARGQRQLRRAHRHAHDRDARRRRLRDQRPQGLGVPPARAGTATAPTS